MAQRYGLKPSKRVFKNVGLEVVSVGFPKTSREKYIPMGTSNGEGEWRAQVSVVPAVPFDEWKASVELPVEQPDAGPRPTLEKLASVSGLPVYKACYDLLLYMMQWSVNVPRDTKKLKC